MARDRVGARQKLVELLERFCEREWQGDVNGVVAGVVYVTGESESYGPDLYRMRFNVGRLADELLAKAEDGKLDYLLGLAPVRA